MTDQASFQILVGGVDVSERFNQLLESLTVSDEAGTTSDSASVTLDDTGGRILMPAVGDPCSIALGWRSSGIAPVFEGTIDEVHSQGSRGGGRTLRISAKGMDTGGKAKQPLEFHKDDATLQEFMAEAAGKAGLGFMAVGEIAAIKRDYWWTGTESLAHLGHRIAREVGATFKIVGGMALMVPRNGGLSASGRALAGVRAVWGDNLLSWDISPVLSRPRFEQMRSRWYDRTKAKWMEELIGTAIFGGAGKAQHTHRYTRADQDEAQKSADNNKRGSERESGNGSVTITGNPGAQPEGTCTVAGVRAGIDGTYRIDSVTHELSRGNGFTTKLGLKQPRDGAGADGRGGT